MSPAAQRRILVVDDHPEVADSLSVLLWTLGHDIHTAYNGCEALEAAMRYHPEVIFLDLMMPGMDGYEVARQIRAQPWGKAIRLVALTALDGEDVRDCLHAVGVDHHLVKPAEVAALEAVLESGDGPTLMSEAPARSSAHPKAERRSDWEECAGCCDLFDPQPDKQGKARNLLCEACSDLMQIPYYPTRVRGGSQ